MAQQAPIKVLLLGGHGKISMLLTPLLLAKSWNVTSVIRNSEHKSEILKLGEGQKGKIDVLIDSLDDVKSDEAASKVLDAVEPEIVVWSAGAGGKGGPSRTFAIDRTAAMHYIRASLSRPSVRKFLMVSHIGSRRLRAPWWSDSDWTESTVYNPGALKNYCDAKLEADELLAAMAHQRSQQDPSFQCINLRPGMLTDEPATGKIILGHTKARGRVSRADVASTAAALLGREDTRGWLDLLEGDMDVEEAVEKVVKEGTDCFEGEEKERIWALVG